MSLFQEAMQRLDGGETDYFDFYIVFQIRQQGRKGFTELVRHSGAGNVELTYETELETKKILASIDEINNALIEEDSSTKDSDTVEGSEARTSTSSNIFQNLWDQILG